MWKTFAVEDDVYMLKIINNSDIYKIYLSDLKTIWSQICTKEEIIEKFKECNPIVVAEVEEAVSQAIKILNEIDNATVTVDKSDNEIDLKIKSEALGISDTKFKLKYELNLLRDYEKKFAEEITAPMIHTINYLEKQQKVLCDLIKKKDRELEEYKMEKGLISRTDLITEPFDLSTIKKSSEKLMLDTYGQSIKFWDNFVNKYENVESNFIEVKADPWNKGKRKRKIYNAKTSAKKCVSEISYKKD